MNPNMVLLSADSRAVVEIETVFMEKKMENNVRRIRVNNFLLKF